MALGVVLIVAGSTLVLLDAPHRALGRQTQAAEQFQRARVAASRLVRDVHGAGIAVADPRHGGRRVRAAVVPTRTGWQDLRSRGVARFDASAITFLRTHDDDALSLLTALSPASGGVVRDDGRCSASRDATCRLPPDAPVLIGGVDGRVALARVTAVDGNRLWVERPDGGRVPLYEAGSTVVPLSLDTYRFDRARSQLRYQGDWGRDVPVLNDVVGLTFRYFGTGRRPASIAVGGGDPCLDPAGRSDRVVPIMELSEDRLRDGPWCGEGGRFDLDLLRIRWIRFEVTLGVSGPDRRGPGGVLTRWGAADDPTRWLPDFTARFDVALRHVGWP